MSRQSREKINRVFSGLAVVLRQFFSRGVARWLYYFTLLG